MIAFTVHGVPVPQGSKKVVPTHAGPRAIETNEAKLRPWRSAVAFEAQQAMHGRELLTGPVSLKAELVFPRPKSHYGSGRNAQVLKGSAPMYVATKPDADKLARSLGDSLTGICFRDDSQIAWVSVWKVYGEPARAVIEVAEIDAAVA